MSRRSGHRQYSLQTRLLLAFTILLCIFLGLTGSVLDGAFRSSVRQGVQEQLQVQLYLFMAAVEREGDGFRLRDNLREPRFSQINSGLYGLISDRQGNELLRTQSALELDFDALELPHALDSGESRFSRLGPDNNYFASSYAVVWDDGSEPRIFSVLESTDGYREQVARFRTSLWTWLGGVAAVLLAMQLLLLRWGLAPLRRLAADLKRMERGQSEFLEGQYPQELGLVTDNLNLLIEAERQQQARYRTTLGDLAHSLKTPLAVMRGSLEALVRQDRDGDGDSLVRETREQLGHLQEQVERMDQIVRYQLQRAVSTNQSTPLARHVPVADVAARVVSALEKVYAERGVQVTSDVNREARFLGDERDLMEILGNLLDNACKYGGGRVWLMAREVPGSPSGSQLSIEVEDDGPGIDGAHRDWVLQRGARADSVNHGQGIGLAVVADIVTSYGGQIEFDNSEHGGARVQVVLPNVRFGG